MRSASRAFLSIALLTLVAGCGAGSAESPSSPTPQVIVLQSGEMTCFTRSDYPTATPACVPTAQLVAPAVKR